MQIYHTIFSIAVVIGDMHVSPLAYSYKITFHKCRYMTAETSSNLGYGSVITPHCLWAFNHIAVVQS